MNSPASSATLREDESRDAQTLALNLLPGGCFPEQITRLTTNRSEGNPFFIEEVIRSLIDNGMITVGKRGFEVQRGIENVEIPHNINEVIMARIDRLDEENSELLRAASIIGPVFFCRILLHVIRSETEIRNRRRLGIR